MTTPAEAQQLINDLTRGHFIELFRMYGMELVPSVSGDVGGGAILYCGIIGFSGEGIRGTMAVAGSDTMLGASNPVPGGAPRDWVAEVANQLMGNVKSRLLGYDVEVWMSTPIVLRGERLALEVRGVVQSHVYTCASVQGQVVLWVDVETTPEFQMSSVENTALSGLDGGKTLMF